MLTSKAPAYTTDEQRTGMFQVWTVAQTVGSYSTVQGATGLGSNAQQDSLPVPPEPLKETGPSSPLDENLKNPTTPPDLNFVDFLPPNLDPTIYAAQLYLSESTSGITSAYLDLVAKQSGIWNGALTGIYNTGGPTDPFDLKFTGSKAEDITISIAGDLNYENNGTWSATSGSGIVYGAEPDITVTLTSGSGTYTGDGIDGTFSGTLSGTWTQ